MYFVAKKKYQKNIKSKDDIFLARDRTERASPTGGVTVGIAPLQGPAPAHRPSTGRRRQ
jgi:hypothetical protein